MALFKVTWDEDDWDTICIIPTEGTDVGLPVTPYDPSRLLDGAPTDPGQELHSMPPPQDAPQGHRVSSP